jgi:alkane 1-monooxygenase
MSTVHPIAGGQAPAYRDRKRLLWLLSVIAPAGVVIGPAAHLLGATSQAWFFVALAVFYIAIPLLDKLLGEDLSNPPESAVPALEADRYYRAINYAVVPVLWAGLLFNCIYLATHELPWASWLATAIITGSMLGFGLNLSHELGHKKDRLGRKVGLFNSALGGYGHFSIEHNRGHHRHVATPEDPASSKMGETIYRFMFRELPGAYFRAWDLESERLDRLGKSAWSLDNEIVQAGLVTAALYGGLIAWFGAAMVPVLAVVAFWGAFQLTSANYIEHYGLVRQQLPNGRYEPCQPHHSWNSNHVLSNLVVFHLQRHSDHHANPIMDPLLIKATAGDVARINFLPAKRQRLMRQYGLQERVMPSVMPSQAEARQA